MRYVGQVRKETRDYLDGILIYFAVKERRTEDINRLLCRVYRTGEMVAVEKNGMVWELEEPHEMILFTDDSIFVCPNDYQDETEYYDG